MKVRISQELVRIDKVIAAAERQLKSAPSETLRLSKGKTNPQFYRVTETTRNSKYLSSTKDADEIAALAQKKYLQRLLKVAQARKNCLVKMAKAGGIVLDAAIQAEEQSKNVKRPLLLTTAGWRPLKREPAPRLDYLENVYDRLDPAIKCMVTPLVPGKDEWCNRWRSSVQSDIVFRPEGRRYATEQGEMVRSKSEVIIADKLHRAGVLFCYEPQLKLGLQTLHPDFLVVDPKTGQELVWEHFGKMGDTDYCRSALERISLYTKWGLTSEHGFVATFESEDCPLDVAMVNKLVETLFT